MEKAKPKQKGLAKLEDLKAKKKRDKLQQAKDQELGALLRTNLAVMTNLRDAIDRYIAGARKSLLLSEQPSDPPSDPANGRPLMEVFALADALIEVEPGKKMDIRDIKIPDCWHLAKALKDQGSKEEGEWVLEVWNLAHKFKTHIEKGLPCRKEQATTPA